MTTEHVETLLGFDVEPSNGPLSTLWGSILLRPPQSPSLPSEQFSVATNFFHVTFTPE